MSSSFKTVGIFFIIFSLFLALSLPAAANILNSDYYEDGYSIYISTLNRPIFRIYYGIQNPALERGKIVQRRVNEILNIINREDDIEPEQVINDIHILKDDGQVKIVFRDIMIITVDIYHAQNVESTREGLAEVWKDNLVKGLSSYMAN